MTSPFGANVVVSEGSVCGCCGKRNVEAEPAKEFHDEVKNKDIIICAECVESISGKEWNPDPLMALGDDQVITLKGLYDRYTQATTEWDRLSWGLWYYLVKLTKGYQVDERAGTIRKVKVECNPIAFVGKKIRELLDFGIPAQVIGKKIRCSTATVLKYSESFSGHKLHPARIEEICKLLKEIPMESTEPEVVPETVAEPVEKTEEVINHAKDEPTSRQHCRNIRETVTDGQLTALRLVLKNTTSRKPLTYGELAKKIKIWQIFPTFLSPKTHPVILGTTLSHLMKGGVGELFGWELRRTVSTASSGNRYTSNMLYKMSSTEQLKKEEEEPKPVVPLSLTTFPHEVRLAITPDEIIVYVKQKGDKRIGVSVIWE